MPKEHVFILRPPKFKLKSQNNNQFSLQYLVHTFQFDKQFFIFLLLRHQTSHFIFIADLRRCRNVKKNEVQGKLKKSLKLFACADKWMPQITRRLPATVHYNLSHLISYIFLLPQRQTHKFSCGRLKRDKNVPWCSRQSKFCIELLPICSFVH